MDVKYTDNEGYEHTEVMSLEEYERRIALPESDSNSLSLAFLNGKAEEVAISYRNKIKEAL